METSSVPILTPEKPPSLNPAEGLALLRNASPKDRVTRIIGVTQNRVKSSPAFREGGALEALTHRNDSNAPSITEQAATYDMNDNNINKQSPQLRSVVTILEQASTITNPDGTPQNDSGDILQLLDENLRIQEMDEKGEPVGEMQTREQWNTKLGAIPADKPEERAAFEAKGVWQFVGLDETPDVSAETGPRSNDTIIQSEIARLTQALAEAKGNMGEDLQAQLDTLRIASLANGPYAPALQREALIHIADQGANISESELTQIKGMNLKDETSGETFSIDRALNTLSSIDPDIAKARAKSSDVFDFLQNNRRLLLSKHGQAIRNMFFSGTSRQLEQIVDPHHLTMLEGYAKKSGLGLLALLALIGFLGNAGLNVMKDEARAA